MSTDGTGRLMDWKKVVASMTKPSTGVMQKLMRRPVTPMSNISWVPPKAARSCRGKTSTASQITQVTPTDRAVARRKVCMTRL